jgi:hypothetical protein
VTTRQYHAPLSAVAGWRHSSSWRPACSRAQEQSKRLQQASRQIHMRMREVEGQYGQQQLQPGAACGVWGAEQLEQQRQQEGSRTSPRRLSQSWPGHHLDLQVGAGQPAS